MPPTFRSSLAAFALALAVGPAAAVTIDGQVTGTAYSYEGNPADTTASQYLRSHAAVRLQAGDLGLRGLSLHTYLRGTTDLADAADDDPGLRVSNLFLRYKNHGADLSVGRQYVAAGVGAGSIDGARIDLARYGLRLTAFGGAQVPVDGYGLGVLSEAHLVGARLRTDRFAGVQLAVSFADRAREPARYRQVGRFSGFLGQPEAVHRQLVGVEASRRFGLHAVSARADYDILGKSLRRGELTGRVGLSPDVSVQAGWRHREPSVYYGSVLSVFASEPYDELSVNLYYRASAELTLSAQAATVLYDDDTTQRFGVSAAIGRNLTLGYRRYQGYSGDTDGINGSLLCPLTRTLTFRGDLDLASHDRMEAGDGLVTAAGSLRWQATRTFSLDGQLQALRNPSYDSDVRFLLRGSWRFRK